MVVEMLAASVASVMDALAANRLVAEGKGETEGERERGSDTYGLPVHPCLRRGCVHCTY